MRNAFCLSLFLPLSFSSVVLAQSAASAAKATASADAYRDEPAIIEHYDSHLRMRADGTGDSLRHVVVRVQSEGAAQGSSVLAIFYNAENSTGTIENVRVHKQDGTVVTTPSTDSMEVAAEITRQAPLYSDLKQRQLPVRSLAAGDTLEYDLHVVFTKPEAPNQFWGAEHFLTNSVVLSETLTLEFPSSKYVQVYSPRHTAAITDQGGMKRYVWTSEQRKGTGAKKPDGKPDKIKDPDEDENGRDLPSVAWTTFHNWTEVGDWYRSLAKDRAQPTDELRARAAALTKDAKTPDEKARAIYNFVSENVRYVGIDFGAGRFQPHFAETTLTNRYGDCKDKDTLLEALLRSAGFQTAPALIGVGITPVPDLPSPALFNHVITTVQIPAAQGAAAMRIWLDSTPGVSPYRLLLPQIRDQEALVVPVDAPASLQRTPKDPPYVFRQDFTATATLDSSGLLTGHFVLDDRTDSELLYRAIEHNVAPSQWDQTMQYLSSSMGFGGTVSNANLRPTPASEPARLTWDYKRPDYANWSQLQILPLFPTLTVTTIDKDTAPEQDIDQGAPRTLSAVTHIKLPEGYRADLPNAIHVKRDYATFDQTYRLSGSDLTVERTVVILKQKVPKADWKDYLAYSKAAGFETGENYIQLVAPEKKAADPKVDTKADAKATPAAKDKPDANAKQDANAKSSEQPSDASASAGSAAEGSRAEVAELMQRADTQYRLHDLDGEKETLLRVKAIDPKTPYLWSMLGAVAMQQHKPDEAIADVKQELANHPDDHSDIPLLLSGIYVQKKQYDEAISLLKKYEDRGDVRISYGLATAQSLSGDKSAAAATLQRASERHPDDRNVLTAYAQALHEAHRDTEAAAAAKAALDGCDDANLLNSNSYLLSEMKVELPLAEATARRSIDMLEERTAKVDVQGANSADFLATAELEAVYDTLAYILLLEKKPAEAEPYQRAAWFDRPDITIGNHLSLIEEALGKRDDALTIAELALGTEHAEDKKDDNAETQRTVERLRKAGAHSRSGQESESLQAQRTFKVKRPADVKGWGTFRVQIGAAGIVASEMVSGSAGLRTMSAELNKLQITQAVPPGSKARLLRDGVLSCSSTNPTCEFVLMPRSGIGAEGVQ